MQLKDIITIITSISAISISMVTLFINLRVNRNNNFFKLMNDYLTNKELKELYLYLERNNPTETFISQNETLIDEFIFRIQLIVVFNKKMSIKFLKRELSILKYSNLNIYILDRCNDKYESFKIINDFLKKEESI